jgi:hypothetical protein
MKHGGRVEPGAYAEYRRVKDSLRTNLSLFRSLTLFACIAICILLLTLSSLHAHRDDRSSDTGSR